MNHFPRYFQKGCSPYWHRFSICVSLWMITQYKIRAQSPFSSRKFVHICLYETTYPANVAFDLLRYFGWMQRLLNYLKDPHAFYWDVWLWVPSLLLSQYKEKACITQLSDQDVIMALFLWQLLWYDPSDCHCRTGRFSLVIKGSFGWNMSADIHSVQGYQVNRRFMRTYLRDGYGIVHFDALLWRSSLNMHRYLVWFSSQ